MKKPAPDDPNSAWLEKFMLGTSADTKTPAFRPALSPSERKSEETTRAFRETNDTARDQRLAATAKLKAARLARDAENKEGRAREKG